MDASISPSELTGTIPAIASKSVAHRQLICAALCPGPTDITCGTTSADIEATMSCLEALGARLGRDQDGIRVTPIPGTSSTDNVRDATADATLDCGESGSTLRFLLPVVCALGRGARVTGHGRLASRPLSPLYEQLVAHGCDLTEQGVFPLVVHGRLRPGRFDIPGDVSSQYVSGLLLAAALLDGPSEVRVSEPFESRSYVNLTKDALELFGVHVLEDHEKEGGAATTNYYVTPATPYRSPSRTIVEGDWSNAAFWLVAGAMGTSAISVSGLGLSSNQGDRAILGVLARFGATVGRRGDVATVSHDHLVGCEIDASDFPDLVPPIAAVAAVAEGATVIRNIGRLRLKESDRIESVTDALSSLGADVSSTEDTMTICGRPSLTGGTVDARNDHRIAMMASIAACRCTSAVTVLGADCVSKSYPGFYTDFARLGGTVRQIGA
ncbi:MAG: 3-phosphoshikimate 1-carboxyvinyltransferase [Atopobiaceae bacterium]|nr:3-phosphoshikimate 1-carboxyvinyltransferase [Atopobiaceae bacterium]MCI2173131.1 3-phosphoshikimate 1-carboxyvinyltransferase [Atopobiaceae bacterium]MCI2208224.1 3-phosphoshikimate 1-carboxyvinyltransferase [Atopobiaceae bacterium]